MAGRPRGRRTLHLPRPRRVKMRIIHRGHNAFARVCSGHSNPAVTISRCQAPNRAKAWFDPLTLDRRAYRDNTFLSVFGAYLRIWSFENRGLNSPLHVLMAATPV